MGVEPSLVERIARDRVCKFFSTLKRGSLTVRLPDGSQTQYRGDVEGRDADITVNRYSFFSKIVWGGGIGLGEAFVDGDWESSDLPQAIALILENMTKGSERSVQRMWPVRILRRLHHGLTRANTIRGAKQNIHDHYDLGNDFFEHILDPL